MHCSIILISNLFSSFVINYPLSACLLWLILSLWYCPLLTNLLSSTISLLLLICFLLAYPSPPTILLTSLPTSSTSLCLHVFLFLCSSSSLLCFLTISYFTRPDPTTFHPFQLAWILLQTLITVPSFTLYFQTTLLTLYFPTFPTLLISTAPYHTFTLNFLAAVLWQWS